MSDVNEFDIAAAWMRHSQTDFRGFVDAFAARMEGAFPANARVTRKREGLFSGKTHAVRIMMDMGQYAYTLSLAGTRLTATRVQTVRGVALKSEEMTVPDWLTALNRDLQALAGQTGDAHGVLHDFLMS